MISALPVSGAWQPKMIGAHDDPPRISLSSESLSCPWPWPPSSGPRWVAHRPWARTWSFSGSMIVRRVSSGGVNSSPRHSMSIGSTSVAHELLRPVQLRLVLGIGLELPGHRGLPSSSAGRITFCQWRIYLWPIRTTLRPGSPGRRWPSAGPDYTGEVRRLIDAGREVMRRCGTDSRPRVADIVAEAGLSNDGFYRHFASKDALVAAILDDGTERLSSYLAHQMAKEATAEGQGPPLGRGRPVPGRRRGERRHHPRRPLERGEPGPDAWPAPTPRPSARLATLLHEPFAELGSVDPELDAELVAHAVVGRLTDLLWRTADADPAETDHLVRFCLAACTAGRGPDGRGAAGRRAGRASRAGGRVPRVEPTPWRMNSQSSSAGSGSTRRDGRPADRGREGVEHDRLEHHPGDRAAAQPGADAPGRLGLVEHLAEQRDQRGEGQGRLGRDGW